jgi:hypothetical protein
MLRESGASSILGHPSLLRSVTTNFIDYWIIRRRG